MDKQNLGKRGEDLAVNFLKKKGYKILDRNFRTSKFGEIDIMALDYSQKSKIFGFSLPSFIRHLPQFIIGKKSPGATIVFIEVKTKSGDEFGAPEEEFTIFKKQKMRRAIQDWFWQKKKETNNWRIDLIAVDFSKNEEEPEIRHYLGCA
ncbi:MAG: YraN family protein [Minisyncoccia bacterium]